MKKLYSDELSIRKRLEEIDNNIKILKSLKRNVIYCIVEYNNVFITAFKRR